MTIDGDLQNDPADIATLLFTDPAIDSGPGWRKDRHDNLDAKIPVPNRQCQSAAPSPATVGSRHRPLSALSTGGGG